MKTENKNKSKTIRISQPELRLTFFKINCIVSNQLNGL